VRQADREFDDSANKIMLVCRGMVVHEGYRFDMASNIVPGAIMNAMFGADPANYQPTCR